MHNDSKIRDMILIGFSDQQHLQVLLFLIFIFMYLFIVIGNVLLLVLFFLEPNLQLPMYFFIGSLSCIEICYTAVTMPKMLAELWRRREETSFSGCLLQAYFLAFIACLVWSLYSPVVETILIYHLPFCGPNEIENFFCDFPPLIDLACADTRVLTMMESALSSLIMLNFLCILLSYIKVILDILKVKSKVGRQKAFSTCGAHLIVVVLFFVSVGLMYIRVGKYYSPDYNRAVGVIFAVFIPFANPVIYGLRNQEIKTSFKKVFNCLGFR
ncbi:hypothetical protein GDO81_014182 [Engystomops pustulosus]|uniref:G-protein coupled receptors family 1 profile domain-containing protein n=1 Tax=Engystomops pustulosus TaxID=76066 RepID=A0AAV7B8K0_ENGPU|nr:hypothetical protein GDO81_014182 [Engystomops pustulosus]